MPDKKDLRLEEYGISKKRYRELKYFCLQYNEKKQKLLSFNRGIDAVAYNGMPKGNNISDITAKKAIKMAEIEADISLIEETVKEAAPEIYRQLLLNVTEENMPYEYLDAPCGRRQFYIARRRFFYLLSEKR